MFEMSINNGIIKDNRGLFVPRRGKSSMKDYSRISDEELEKMCFVNADKEYITNVISNSKRLVEEGKYKVIVSVQDVDEDTVIVDDCLHRREQKDIL